MNSYSATFQTGENAQGTNHSLPTLRNAGIAPHRNRLPVTIRIVIGSFLRNMNSKKVDQKNIINPAERNTIEPGIQKIPFTVNL